MNKYNSPTSIRHLKAEMKMYAELTGNCKSLRIKSLRGNKLNIDYITGYMNSGTETHNCLIDPMHIGAITDDGSGALRVLEYYIHSSFAGTTKTIYHASKYADLTDSQWEDMRQAAIRKLKDRQEVYDATVEGKLALLEAGIGTSTTITQEELDNSEVMSDEEYELSYLDAMAEDDEDEVGDMGDEESDY